MRISKINMAAALLVAATLAPMHGAAILSLSSANVNPGTLGNVIELTLTNTGPSAISIGAFNFAVSTPVLGGITFSDATVNTTSASYIFSGSGDSFVIDSLGGFSVVLSGAGTNAITGNDFRLTPGAATLVGSGVTVGLAHLLFDVNAATSYGIQIAAIGITLAESNLADGNGNTVTINSFVNGQISVIPEPSSIVLLGAGILGALAARRHTRA